MTNHPNRSRKRKIRAIIRADADARGIKYRMTADGGVQYYGVMPNTNSVGWYFGGYADEVAADIERDMLPDQRTL